MLSPEFGLRELLPLTAEACSGVAVVRTVESKSFVFMTAMPFVFRTGSLKSVFQLEGYLLLNYNVECSLRSASGNPTQISISAARANDWVPLLFAGGALNSCQLSPRLQYMNQF